MQSVKEPAPAGESERVRIMKHAKTWKQVITVLLALVMTMSLAAPALAVGTAKSSSGLSWEKVDNDAVSVKLPIKEAVSDEDASGYADTDEVRVSIVLDGASTLEKGFSIDDIASNVKAVAYREDLEAEQDKTASAISTCALDDEELDVVWHLTLAANIISANVEYGQIEEIEKVPGVKEVLIETRYEPCVVNDAEPTDPNMATSGKMIGSSVAWANGYTGAGSKVAIIDTGADTDHPSLDPDAFEYAVKDSGAKLMNASDIAAVLDQLHVSDEDHMPGVSAEDLYVDAKIPFGYNYVDNSLDVTHDNDAQGDHGSHVTGIAAGNRYIKNEDGTYSNALDTALTQGVAPDAQVLTMKVFGAAGGAYDSDYMAAIEDAIILGADSANLSLGSGNPGFSHNSVDAYQTILENVTKSGMVVVMSAGNSGNWFENTPNKAPYAESVSWQTDGTPGSFTNSLAVASIDNDGATGNYVEVAGTKMTYTETTGYTNAAMTTIAGEHEFVYVDAPGSDDDFAAVKDVLKGKIALCNRGGISFYQKGENAVNNGAIATIIVNNAAGTINMDLSDYTKSEPCVSLLLSDGLYIKANAEAVQDDNGKILYYTGKMTVGDKPGSALYNSDHYTMSSFSSWGVPGSLELKPEITAPGGNIYSLMNGGGYQNMSGTSMAAPQITGMVAVVAQYIKANGLAEKTGLTDRQLAQSLLMSTATPVIEDHGEDGLAYASVLQQGAGLANVGAAVTSGSYILMDENATKSYADGKIKAELGDDPDRTGSYSFGFTIYNLEDSATAFTLAADFFTQNVFTEEGMQFEDSYTALLPSNVSWTVDGKDVDYTAPDALLNCDFDGNGKISSDDGQALLDYVTGVRESIYHEENADFDDDGDIDTYDAYLFFKQLNTSMVNVPANGSVHVTINAQVLGLDQYDKASKDTGTYVEGYVYADEVSSAEGVEGVSHSIPVLGYYGSWSEPSMFDIGSRDAYLTGEENRAPYMYTQGGNSAMNYQTLTVKYNGDSNTYFFGGNPYVDEDFYDLDRNSINPDTAVFYRLYFSLIRNAAASKLTITDDQGNVYLAAEGGSNNSAYYYTNGSSWRNCQSSFNINDAPKKAEDGSKLNITLTMAPEYYVDYSGSDPVVDWDALEEGSSVTYTAVVDKIAPEVSDVHFSDDKNSLIVTGKDNRYVAAAALFDYDAGSILSKVGGSGKDAKLGDAVTMTLDTSDIGSATHLLLQVYDYADNYVTYKINLNEDELSQPVSVTLNESSLDLLVGSSEQLTADVQPFGIQPDGVKWTSGNESVATVDQNGVVTAVSPGSAVITATSLADATKTASCNVTVKTVNATLYGALQDKEGTAEFYSWDLEHSKTWTAGAELEAKSVTAATMDARTGDVYVVDANYNVNKVDLETGKTLGTYSGLPGASSTLPMWDVEYSLIFSTEKAPLMAGVYYIYLLAPQDPTNIQGRAFDFQTELMLYGGANYFTALTSVGSVMLDTDKDGEKETTAELFLALDDAGNLWNLSLYPVGNGWKASVGLNNSNLADLGLDFAGNDGDMFCSMTATEEDEELVLYLSYFTGETNEIYRMTFVSGSGWVAKRVGDVGADVWPATIFASVDNHAENGADYVPMPAETFTAEAVELSPDEIERFNDGNGKNAAKPVVGSLNGSSVKTTSETTSPVTKAEEETVASNMVLSDDEKTLTVNVVAAAEDATTNGLMTVEYDGKALTLADVSICTDYSSHKDEDGKVTLGYVSLNGLPVGATAATLTFTVNDPEALENTTVTVHQTELNQDDVDETEKLEADFHTETEVVGKKDPTCTEKGYTGDLVCTKCGKILTKGEEIPATGHDFKDGVCTKCGLKASNAKTGDNSHVTLVSALMVISVAAVVILFTRKKRYC